SEKGKRVSGTRNGTELFHPRPRSIARNPDRALACRQILSTNNRTADERLSAYRPEYSLQFSRMCAPKSSWTQGQCPLMTQSGRVPKSWLAVFSATSYLHG